jgi:hypothetical protein
MILMLVDPQAGLQIHHKPASQENERIQSVQISAGVASVELISQMRVCCGTAHPLLQTGKLERKGGSSLAAKGTPLMTGKKGVMESSSATMLHKIIILEAYRQSQAEAVSITIFRGRERPDQDHSKSGSTKKA